MTNIQSIDYSVDLLRAILWQYNDATRMQSLLQQKQDWYDEYQSAFWQDWYDDVFNLQTANEFGLTVWSLILNVPIIVSVAPTNPALPSFGFTNTHSHFVQGNFSNRGSGAQTLTVEQARTVLRMRYFQITSRGTIPEINRFFKVLFGNLGSAYAIDGHDMTIMYVFRFPLSAQLRFIFQNYDLFPRPAGVGARILIVPDVPFGFEQYNQNFDNGNFLTG